MQQQPVDLQEIAASASAYCVDYVARLG